MILNNTCINDSSDVNIGETIGKLIDVDNAVDTVGVEVIANLTLDSLVLRPK